MSGHNRRGQGGAKLRQTLVTWAGVYPVLTAIAVGLEPVLAAHPLPLRTLAMSMIMVPIMVFMVSPLAARFLGRWIAGNTQAR